MVSQVWVTQRKRVNMDRSIVLNSSTTSPKKDCVTTLIVKTTAINKTIAQKSAFRP